MKTVDRNSGLIGSSLDSWLKFLMQVFVAAIVIYFVIFPIIDIAIFASEEEKEEKVENFAIRFFALWLVLVAYAILDKVRRQGDS